MASEATTPQAVTMSSDQASAASKSAVPGATTANAAASGNDKTGPRYKRAYLLSLDKGALAFLEAQDIQGDFAPKRGREEVWSTMLRCRLLSETNDVLAEELLPAPDQVCHVLDPRSDTTQPVNFTPPGPVVFQVRMPRVNGARKLDIYRILQPGEPPVENLLGSIPLPRQ